MSCNCNCSCNSMTDKVLKCFEELSKVPRGSKKEEKIRDWLINWANQHQLKSKVDKVGNLLIEVPASKGYENAPCVVLQGHLDMVCEKTPESSHDFSKDPIEFVLDGEWLKANQTTLGADNGIAIAMAMVAATEENLEHPPLELLFTVDEETGLTGATYLETGFLSGKILLNLDSEDEGYFTVGCAGGKNTSIKASFEFAEQGEEVAYNIRVGGLKGGHSGVDIKCYRANAIQLTTRTVKYLLEKMPVRVAEIKGGSAHNAIPRDCSVTVFVKKEDIGKLQEEILNIEKIFQCEYKNTDPELKITLSEAKEAPKRAMTLSSTEKMVELMDAVPHGPASMSTHISTLVETSNNFATIAIEEDKVAILTSQRSSVMSRLEAHTKKIEGLGKLAGAEVHSSGGYPAWQPNMDSPLLARCKEIYVKMFQKEPVVEVIHAGLECGIIGSKYEGMDMISFGPTIRNPHCPDERLYIPSVIKVWDFLVELLKSYKVPAA